MLQLPDELLVMIAEMVPDQRDINAMVRTSHRLRNALNQHLYRRNATDEEIRGTALPWAIENDMEETARRAILEGAPQLDQALNLAAKHGRRVIGDMLLAAEGVNGDFKDEETGYTPLLFAARAGDIYFVKRLIETGHANIEARDVVDRTALYLAAQGGHVEIVVMLLDTGRACFGTSLMMKRMLPLEVALMECGEGGARVAKALIDSGRMDVNMRDDLGRTPLSRAAYWGSEAGTKLLLESEGIEPDVADVGGEGKTPLAWAAKWGHEGVVKMLLDTGRVDINSRDVNGRTPLSWAAELAYKAIPKMLVGTGEADLNSTDDRLGRTPLMWAVARGNEEVVDLLLESGADAAGIDQVPPPDQGPPPENSSEANDVEIRRQMNELGLARQLEAIMYKQMKEDAEHKAAQEEAERKAAQKEAEREAAKGEGSRSTGKAAENAPRREPKS